MAGSLNKSSCLAPTLGATKFIKMRDDFGNTLLCYLSPTQMFNKPTFSQYSEVNSTQPSPSVRIPCYGCLADSIVLKLYLVFLSKAGACQSGSLCGSPYIGLFHNLLPYYLSKTRAHQTRALYGAPWSRCTLKLIHLYFLLHLRQGSIL